MGCLCSSEDDVQPNVDRVDHTHFKMLKVVGKGGFGKVNAVTHKGSGKLLAMKRLRKAKLIARNMYITTAWRERNVMSLLKSPFLVNLLYAFQDTHYLFLIMPFMQGGDLRYFINSQGAMSESICQFYVAEIVLGLQELHNLHIVYRDLKPDNVLLDETGHARISDFGLAVILKKEHNYLVSGSAGTPGYQAPEVVSKKLYGTAADLWSLGVTIYELVQRQRPFKTVDEILRDDITVTFRHPVKDETKDLIRKLLVRDPSKRLGMGPRGFEDIRNHPFFKGVEWEKLGRLEIPPPFQPQLDRANCPADFELEDQFFGDAERKREMELTDEQQKLFEGYEFNVDLDLGKKDQLGTKRVNFDLSIPSSTQSTQTNSLLSSSASPSLSSSASPMNTHNNAQQNLAEIRNFLPTQDGGSQATTQQGNSAVLKPLDNTHVERKIPILPSPLVTAEEKKEHKASSRGSLGSASTSPISTSPAATRSGDAMRDAQPYTRNPLSPVRTNPAVSPHVTVPIAPLLTTTPSMPIAIHLAPTPLAVAVPVTSGDPLPPLNQARLHRGSFNSKSTSPMKVAVSPLPPIRA